MARKIDKQLRDRTERAALERHDSERHSGHRKLDGQDFDLRASGGKPQNRCRKDCQKAPSRQKTDSQLRRDSRHSDAGKIQSAGAKGCRRYRADDSIRPTKVVRGALQGATSVAGLLITTEAMVADVPKKQSTALPGGGMGGMDFVSVAFRADIPRW